jgi:hypothetical protein
VAPLIGKPISGNKKMPLVSMPDGAQVQFPDDMQPEQIRSMMIEKFPQLANPAEVESLANAPANREFLANMVKNVPSSAVNLATNIVQPVLHPVDTVTGIYNAGKGALQKAGVVSGEDAIPNADAVGQFFKERYGGAKEIAKTIEEDPVGFLADLSTVLSLGGTAVARAPGVAGEIAGAARTAGTAINPLTPVAAAVRRVVTPLSTAPTRAAAVENLRAEGVDVSAGQSTGKKFLRKAEEELGGSTTQALAERQSEQFTAAVARRFGTALDENSPRLTQEVMTDSFTRVGDRINDLARNNNLLHDRQLTNAVIHAVGDYNDLVPPTLRSRLVERVEHAVNNNTNAALMTGEQYQSLRSRLGSLARASSRDPEQSRAVYRVQNALDDAMERSIQVQNPQMVGEWQQARAQYRNLLVAERALSKTSESASSGLITPQALSEAVKAVGGRADLTRGRNDLAVLARNGSEVIAPLANSNTASRARIHQMLAVPGAIIGGGLGASHGIGAPEAMAAALAGAAIPRAVGEGLVRGRRYLGNTVIQGQLAPGVNPAGLVSNQLGRQEQFFK